MNAHKFPLGRSNTAPVSVPMVAAPVYSPVAGAATSFTRIARVPGEAFDADQIGWSCDECGRDEWSCECDAKDEGWPALTSFPGGDKLTIEQALDRIARVFLGVERSALLMPGSSGR